MTFPTTSGQHPDPDPLSGMSDEQYVTYQRRIDDDLIKRFYAHGLVPPEMTPMPSTVDQLEPPF